VNLDVKRGERICIVGDNGIGKTTLLKILMGEITGGSGRVKIGYNVKFGYYDQGQQLLNPANSVIGELQESYGSYTDGELRNILGRFLFRGEEVFLNVGSLSGGEKARLSLLKLMLSGANVLILDEPTNHLDIDSKEIFEEALLEFPGTCIIVSHDRYFLNRIPTRIVELTKTGLDNYLGTYDYYVEKKQEMIQSGKSYLEEMGSRDAGGQGDDDGDRTGRGGEENLSSAEKRRLQKEREAAERRAARQKEALEKEIQDLEEAISNLERELCLEENMTDHVKLTELSNDLSSKKLELESKYDKWLELQD
jgi:ATP-binding cassette subfamily F protein 3